MKSPFALSSFITPCLVGTGLLASAAAQTTLDAWTTQVGPIGIFDARATGVAGQAFALFSSPMGDSLTLGVHPVIATGRFDALGNAQITRRFGTALPVNFGVNLHLVTRNPTSATGMDVETLSLALSGNGGTLCTEFDPNYSLGQMDPITGVQIEPVPGQQLSNEWSLAGMNISATNNTPGHPDVACTFDSANPTGGDWDLETPGYGPGNNVGGFGQVIIIAENDLGAGADNVIDEPDDEELGGTIRFDFDEPYHMCSATLLDVDQDEFGTSELRFYIGDPNGVPEVVPMDIWGDNSLQTLTFDKRNVRAFEVVFAGSGAIARLEMVPCPVVLNFDETPFGKPLGMLAGEYVNGQFASLGLTVDTVNAGPGPDESILFDTHNPTGGDWDLATLPGYHPSNTEPLGMVLVIPENGDDADMDGRVDDPNDGADGGIITLTFDSPITFKSAQVLDVDGLERDNFIFRNEAGTDIAQIDIDALPMSDNSVQTVEWENPLTGMVEPIYGVKTIVIVFDGSGAVSRLRWCPESNGPPMP